MVVRNYCVVVSGPTGVGKTVFVDAFGLAIDGEIINGDLGQLYLPLTIGTAKPNWQQAPLPHHLFDIITTPVFFSVMAFRMRVIEVCHAIWQRNKIPIIVGGSSYYIAALFFPPAIHATVIKKHTYHTEKDLWQELYAIDPERANEIDPHDLYRIQRALDIWHSTGVKPSAYKPQYDPIADFIFIWLDRTRAELYQRIDQRVKDMLNNGWIDEVRALLNTPWEPFLCQKKIIGYKEVIAYCRGEYTYEAMVTIIQKKTRNYAKRQLVFWRALRQKLNSSLAIAKDGHKERSIIQEVNLTHAPVDRYIKQLKSIIMNTIVRK